MEPLVKQLSALPAKLLAMSTRAKVLLGLGLLAVVGAAVGTSTLSTMGEYQYAFTNLSTEDAAEVQAQLKTANVPFRLEAGGTALAVPASKVYEVRLLLASAGLPRSNGTGFELFDKGDFGVSEFTQKVNLRRATEGELARTVGRLEGVRSARVHLVLPEKAVFRGEERPASAAVVLNLQPGKALSERELAGIKHLVASAVPSLNPGAVTIVDGRGAVLAAEDGAGADAQGYARKMERDLEQRVVSLLEPVVGSGQVVARVTADVDSSEVTATNDNFDPDGTVLKTERTSAGNQNQQSDKGGPSAVGAVANQPMATAQAGAGSTTKSNNTTNEENRTWEISRVTTRTVTRAPRLTRLSVAVLLDGVAGKPRDAAEVQRLGELVRKAVGFDANRGDQLEISSEAFSHSAEDPAAAAAVAAGTPWWVYAAAGGGALLVLAVLAMVLLRGRAPAAAPLMLKPGSTVAQIEANALKAATPVPSTTPVSGALPAGATPAAAAALAADQARELSDGATELTRKARELASADPVRAANLIRSWLSTHPNDTAART